MAFLVLLFLLFVRPVQAIYDPQTVPNNRYGIHVADTNDITDTAPLVNSNGGDWGYITLVIQDNDRDPGKWQTIFNHMRRLHLIPIVRLATHVTDDAWEKPSKEDAGAWADFLSALNWPVENRYVTLFNEPNHAKEWGNTIDPEGYADILIAFAQALKATSEDFFILPAGFDSSAANDGEALSEDVFLSRMIAAKPDIFMNIDGWASHSYPNPAFSGSPGARGRGTIAGYIWELNFLRELGLQKYLPVFITETGWRHSQGKVFDSGALSPEQVAKNITRASEDAWTDPNIIAITPFIYNYQDRPFDHFSWRKLGINSFYAPYDAYQNIPKVNGSPRQHHQYEIIDELIPGTLVVDSSYTIIGIIQNQGQAIVKTEDGYVLELVTDKKGFSVVFDDPPTIEPGEKGVISYHLKTPATPGHYTLTINLVYRGTKIPLASRTIELVPPPTINLTVPIAWKTKSNLNDITLLIYDQDRLIKKFTGLWMIDGNIRVSSVSQIVPGTKYRIVVLAPYYLPRQQVVTIGPKETMVTMKRLLPFDFNKDGALSTADLFAIVGLTPHAVISLFIGP